MITATEAMTCGLALPMLATTVLSVGLISAPNVLGR